MAKIYGLFGSMNGKVADVVMAVRNGEQIVRKYQPNVANPSTQLQVESRAKLKLMSQMSAVMGDIIAFPRVGSMSPRNMFVKKNYGNATFSSGEAQFDVTKTDLTGGVLFCSITNAANDGTNVTCNVRVGEDVDTVEVAVFGTVGDELRLLATQQLTPSAGTAAFTRNLSYSAPTYIMAYGVRMNSETAKAKYANILVPQADVKALLSVIRMLSTADVTLTETAVVHINAVNP